MRADEALKASKDGSIWLNGRREAGFRRGEYPPTKKHPRVRLYWELYWKVKSPPLADIADMSEVCSDKWEPFCKG